MDGGDAVLLGKTRRRNLALSSHHKETEKKQQLKVQVAVYMPAVFIGVSDQTHCNSCSYLAYDVSISSLSFSYHMQVTVS